MNEDFKIMTVSFSDITDKQFTEQLKERLYNHCIRFVVDKETILSFSLLSSRMEERHEETKQKIEMIEIKSIIKTQKFDIREIKTIVNNMEHCFDQDHMNFISRIEEFKIKQEKDNAEIKSLLEELKAKKLEEVNKDMNKIKHVQQKLS